MQRRRPAPPRTRARTAVPSPTSSGMFEKGLIAPARPSSGRTMALTASPGESTRPSSRRRAAWTSGSRTSARLAPGPTCTVSAPAGSVANSSSSAVVAERDDQRRRASRGWGPAASPLVEPGTDAPRSSGRRSRPPPAGCSAAARVDASSFVWKAPNTGSDVRQRAPDQRRGLLDQRARCASRHGLEDRQDLPRHSSCGIGWCDHSRVPAGRHQKVVLA